MKIAGGTYAAHNNFLTHAAKIMATVYTKAELTGIYSANICWTKSRGFKCDV